MSQMSRRPYPINTLFFTALLLFTLAILLLLLGVSAFVAWQSRSVQAETERALFDSIRSELTVTYRSLSGVVESRRSTYRQAHARALEQVQAQWPEPDLAGIQQELMTDLGIPLDLYLINPERQVEQTTYPPDQALDFTHPALYDGLSMIARAEREDRIVVSSPILEVVSRNFRIYSYSPVPETDHILELGFVSPVINDYFSEVDSRLSGREAFDAELYFLMWDDWLLSLTPDRGTEMDKQSLLDHHYQKQQALIDHFRQARETGEAVRMRGQNGLPTYFVHLMDIAAGDDWDMSVMSRIDIRNDAISTARNNLLWVLLTAAAVMTILGLITFLLARRHLTRPLAGATQAIEHWEPIRLEEGGQPVRELQLLASHFNTMLDSARSRIEGLDRKSRTDSLTGLVNRSGLESELEVEVRRSRRYGHPFTLVLIDLDHFKTINDEHGHLTGDKILRKVAAVLVSLSRDADTVSRWGGEEFLLICRDTRGHDAVALAEKLRQGIESGTDRAGHRCTASFGITEFRPPDTAASLFERTDRALYIAKREGRNRIHIDPGQ